MQNDRRLLPSVVDLSAGYWQLAGDAPGIFERRQRSQRIATIDVVVHEQSAGE